MLKNNLKNFFQAKYFTLWIVFAIAIIFSGGISYFAVQQSLRQSADITPTQIAEDIANELNNGANPSQFSGQTDIATSLSPYLIIYDDNGQPISSTGLLNGQVPSVPSGVLDSAKKNGEDKVTWQPKAGARSAIVAVPFSGSSKGVLVVGQSLREVERISGNILLVLGISLLAVLVVSLAVAIFLLPRFL